MTSLKSIQSFRNLKDIPGVPRWKSDTRFQDMLPGHTYQMTNENGIEGRYEILSKKDDDCVSLRSVRSDSGIDQSTKKVFERLSTDSNPLGSAEPKESSSFIRKAREAFMAKHGGKTPSQIFGRSSKP